MDFIEPCFGIGHNLSLICQMTSEDIKHQLIIITATSTFTQLLGSKLSIEAGEEGDYISTYWYTVTTRMTPALKWAAMGAILMSH